jgi:D-alanyl-D-alanine carboxypeptidase
MATSTDIAEIQAKIDELEKEDTFSGSLLVTQNGLPILSSSVGFADRAQKIPNNLSTLFNLGSAGKMFTAIAIAHLAERGQLRFTDSLSQYLVDYPNADVKKVTIHQLLTHTGGTGDIFGPDFNANLEKLKNPKDFIGLFGSRGVSFEPGTQYAYSNYGFILLGLIIEKVSGQSYYDYIRQHIYWPAKMTASDSYLKTEQIPNMAIGYMRDPQGALQSNEKCLVYRGMPTGGGYSTVEDLTRFAQSLLSYKLLSEAYTTLVTTGKVDTPDGHKYAYGFRDRNENQMRSFGHSGGGPGMNSTLRIYPVSGHIIAVLSNFDYPAADNVAALISTSLFK